MVVNGIPENLRKEIFAAVVQAEDSGERPSDARRLVAKEYGISVELLREIEEEGIDKTWPPLEECDEEEGKQP